MLPGTASHANDTLPLLRAVTRRLVVAALERVRVTSDARLSVANATFYMLLDVGVGVGPILLGIVAPLIGYANLYLCMAVVGALALALFLVVAKTEKGAR